MNRPEETILAIFAFVLGAIVGSFLNAVIHRLPRSISLHHPRRSFCPSCQRTLPWHENLPLVSYLFLRGKCAGCGARIPVRYWIVEAVTAGIFLWLWLAFRWELAVVYWIFTALLIAATFIDFEHFIIPDEITWGGVGAGLAASLLVPELMGTASRGFALLNSLIGAAAGYCSLWAVVEAGKICFGRKKHAFAEPVPFRWERHGETAAIEVEDERTEWEEIFSRRSDQLVLECPEFAFDGQPPGSGQLVFFHDRVRSGGVETPLDGLQSITGKVSQLVIPREAMGFGDVKFLAAIGAFLGWPAVFFTIFAGSIAGCVFGVIVLLRAGRGGVRIPFGPYLALGALLWLAGGRELWDWYFQAF
ncbi:MAG TPA: prepilin peptidase [Chthoniobacterales bacterium]